jgi:hypothetical protein
MIAKRRWLCAWLLVLTGTVARAQTPSVLPASPQPSVITADTLPLPGQVLSTLPMESPAAMNAPLVGAAPAGAAPANPLLAQADILAGKPLTTQAWLDYEQPACCGMAAHNGPIGYDLFFRSGTSVPLGGNVLSHELNAGLMFNFGGRSLFFNSEGSAAWVGELGVFYDYHDASGQRLVSFANVPATIRDYLRVGVNVGVGRDWYFTGQGYVPGDTGYTHVFGVDSGIRYGSNHVGLNVQSAAIPYTRRQDNMFGTYLALHTDWIIPQGGWDLILGGRIEADYTYSAVLRTDAGDLFSLNFLLTAGIRY